MGQEGGSERMGLRFETGRGPVMRDAMALQEVKYLIQHKRTIIIFLT